MSNHATITVSVAPTLDATLEVTVDRSSDLEYFEGKVEGHAFRFKTASLSTAERERDKAMRALAAWQAIIDTGMVR